MKLVKLRVQGFRSLYDVTWEPGPLTVLIGPNAGGKSNLLKALELLSAAVRGKLEDWVIRQGGMGALLFDGTAERISLTTTTMHSDTKQIEYTLVLRSHALTSAPAVELEEFRMRYVDDNGAPSSGANTTWRRKGRTLENVPDITPDQDAVNEQESILPAILAWDETGSSDLLVFFFSVQYFARFLATPDAPVRHAPVARHATALGSDGQNLIAVLHTLYTNDRDFKHTLHGAMRSVFGEEFEELVFSPADDQRVQLRIRWRGLKRAVSAADLSEGTLRFLFLVTALANPHGPALMAIEEPEAGLHPAMLSTLVDLAREAARTTQVVFVTHSAKFLDAFGEEPPTVTVVRNDAGKTTLSNLRDDELRHWLHEYTLGRLFDSGQLENMA